MITHFLEVNSLPISIVPPKPPHQENNLCFEVLDIKILLGYILEGKYVIF